MSFLLRKKLAGNCAGKDHVSIIDYFALKRSGFRVLAAASSNRPDLNTPFLIEELGKMSFSPGEKLKKWPAAYP